MDPGRPRTRSRHRTITVVDLPEQFANRKTIRQHFSQFGHVSRVNLSSDFSTASVHFKTEEDARNAAINGDVWQDELLNIVGAPTSRLDPRLSSPQSAKSYEDLDYELLNDGDDIDPSEGTKSDDLTAFKFKVDDLKSKKVRSTRRVMIDHINAPKIKRPSAGTSDFSKSEPDDPSSFKIHVSDEKRTLKRVGLPAKPSKLSKVHKSGSSSKKKMSPKKFKHLIAKSLKDKFTILNERDKWLKKLLSKSNAPKSTLKGTCPDMCPEKERIMRDYRSLCSIFETSGKEMVHELAIKEYSRSSADQEEPLPHELRPAPVLTMTMSYLINCIIPEIDNPNLKESVSDWFDFCWDRLRGIRKDITQQQLCDVSIVAIIEQCARFHIACYDRLYGLEPKIFDQKINRENIMNCLSSLNHLYKSLSQSGMCTNEAEFKAYQILVQLNSSDILWEFQNFPQHIQNSQELKVAVRAHLLFSSKSYAQFFDLVEKTSYLNSCLLQTYFPIIRENALIVIIKAYSPPKQSFTLNADFVKQSFRLNDSELKQFCDNPGVDLLVDANEIMFNRDELFARDLVFSFLDSSDIVVNKRQALSHAVVNSDVLPIYTGHKVHSSFDDDGKLNKFAYQAVDQEMKLKQDFNFFYRPLLDPTELNYESDSDVQIISDEEFDGYESDLKPEVFDIEQESGQHSIDVNFDYKYASKEESLEALEETRKRLLQNLEKAKRREELVRKEQEWKVKESEELRKARLRSIEEEKRKEAQRLEEEMRLQKEQELQRIAAQEREKQRLEEEARLAKMQRDMEIKRMEEEVQRRMNEEKERRIRLLEEQKRQEEERLRREKFAMEQERMRQQEIERQRKVCEEEERQRRLREEQRKIREEQERLMKIEEEERRQEEAERKRRLEEAERQRKLKEEIRRRHLMKEKDEELNILRSYLSLRLKALSVRHCARTWKRKIEKIRQANINFPALVRMTADENLALWGTVGNRTSVPSLKTSERLNRLKSTSKVISQLNQSKLNVPFIGDILAEKIVAENLKLNESLIQFVFCKLVFCFPTNDHLEDEIAKFIKQCLASALLPKSCKFSEGFSIVTSHSIPAFTSINVIQGLSDFNACHGMNGAVIFSRSETSHELLTRVRKILSSLKCSVPIPLIITTLDEDLDSDSLTDFLNLLKKDKILIHWEIHNWTNWSSFCKSFLSVFSKYVLTTGNISVNSLCNLMKSLLDELFSILRSKGDLSEPANIVEQYNKFLVKTESYLTSFKHQDIPREFESLLVKSCCRVVRAEKPNLTNDRKWLERCFGRLMLENFEEKTPKSVKDMLDILKFHCQGRAPLFSQLVRLLELSDEDDKDFSSFLKRVPWVSIIETLAQEKLEHFKRIGDSVFVVFKMKDLLQLAHDFK